MPLMSFKLVVIISPTVVNQTNTLKTALLIIQHTCAIHEMYNYGRSKLMICLIIDNIIDTST